LLIETLKALFILVNAAELTRDNSFPPGAARKSASLPRSLKVEARPSSTIGRDSTERRVESRYEPLQSALLSEPRKYRTPCVCAPRQGEGAEEVEAAVGEEIGGIGGRSARRKDVRGEEGGA
jgi:hypothetical protein